MKPTRQIVRDAGLTIMAVSTIGILYLGGVGGCGGDASSSGGTGEFTGVTVDSSSTTGTLAVGGTMDVDADGNLLMRLNAIPNPDNPTTPYASTDLTFSETAETTSASSLEVGDPDGSLVNGLKEAVINCTTITGGTTTSPADIVFVLDTTGSMSGAISGIKDSIQSFATATSSSGVDALFAMVTFGNDFNTTSEDGCDRTLLDFSGSTSTESATALKTFMDTHVSACGGNGAPENPLGALNCARSGGACALHFRSGASRIFVVITDALGHAKGTTATQCPLAGGDSDTFIAGDAPPSLADVKKNMGTDAVFTITNTTSSGGQTTPPTDGCELPSDLAINGGINTELPTSGSFSLTAIPLTSFVTSGYNMSCTKVGVCGTSKFTCTATDAKGRSGTITWNATATCRRD